jgi:Asp-tRNA(Asn)/Glu-tRNA(Gln) amidotransferase B subunit
LTFIIGQVMKATRGRANPGVVKEIIIEELGGK